MEGKAFSGTASYTTPFNIQQLDPDADYTLDLEDVDMAAAVSVNGDIPYKIWAIPYRVDITDMFKSGEDTLSIAVTSTWFNRVVFDSGITESRLKTWTVAGPNKDAPLRKTGLMGPVNLQVYK